MNIKMIKQRAREIARVNKTSLARICLIIGIISALPSLLNADNALIRILHFIAVVLLLAVEQGYVVAGLKAVTDREYDLSDNDAVYGVMNWIEYIPTYLTKFLVNFVCGAIFVMLILILSFGSIATVFASIDDSFGVSPLPSIMSNISSLSLVLLLIVLVAAVFVMCWINLRMFAMTYLHQEYGMKGFDALKESFSLMKGHCWDLFKINLSFIGWIFLCAIIEGMISELLGQNGIAGLLGAVLGAAIGAYTYQPAYITVHALFYKEIAFKRYEEGRSE